MKTEYVLELLLIKNRIASETVLMLSGLPLTVIELPLKNKVAFVNHLQIVLNRDPQVLKITLENNKNISKKIMNQIKKISNELTVQLDWKTEELCMIDNHRFMHGRRKIIKNETRDILNIQTLRANLD